MAKKTKKETKQLEAIPVPEKSVASDIDLKLSKQDLIDMVVEETRTKLEAEREELQKIKEEAYIKYVKSSKNQEPIKAALIKAVKEEYKEEFKAFENAGVKMNSEARVSCGRWGGGGEKEYILTENGLVTHNEHYENRMKTMISEELISSISFESESSKKERKFGATLNMNLCIVPNKKQLEKAYANHISVVKEYAATSIALTEVNRKLRDLDKMGKKVKGQLVKRILESSADGQSVLANLDSVRQTVSATLMLDIAKK